jgi:hypothetical protein
MAENVLMALADFTSDHEWINGNSNLLRTKYSNQWIAVKNAAVIVSDPDLHGLLAKLPDPSHTCVEFIAADPLEMVL